MCPSRNWPSLGMRSFTPLSTSLAKGRQMLTTDMEATVDMASWPPLLPLWTLVLLGQALLSPLTLLMLRRLLILQLLMVPTLSRELLLLASGRLMPTMVMEAMVLLSQRLNLLTLASSLLRALVPDFTAEQKEAAPEGPADSANLSIKKLAVTG